ncbi:MAG: 30S ribosomal protein S6 [Longimicrobiaceae bacterium]
MREITRVPESRRMVDLDLASGTDVHFRCVIDEVWEVILDEVIRCGARRSFQFRCRRGVSTEEKSDLASDLKGSVSLGIAKLESQLQEKTGETVRFEDAVERVDDYEFSAPDCGSHHILIFRLMRVYTFTYSRKRWWRLESWRRVIHDRTDRIRDYSTRENDDPNCGCEQGRGPTTDGRLELDIGSVVFSVEYKITPSGLLLPSLAHTLPVTRETLPTTVTVPRQVLPAYLLFLAQISDETIAVKVRLYGKQIEQGAEFDRRQVESVSDQEKRDAEIVYIFFDSPDDEIARQLKDIHNYFSSLGGTVGAVDIWGPRRLAYPIDGAEVGYYVVAQMEVPGNILPDFESYLLSISALMRYLIVMEEGEQDAKAVAEEGEQNEWDAE